MDDSMAWAFNSNLSTRLLCGAAALCLLPAAAGAQDAGQSGGAGIQLDTITVETAGAVQTPTGPVDGYVARQTLTGSKTDTPILEVPQSISVVTRDQMEARGVQTLGQALDYSAGIVSQPFGSDPRFDSPIIRGFSAANSQYLNSLKLMRDAGAVAIEPYGLERIEVLRGPASVLYGQGNPGGLINMVSKRPVFETLGEVNVQAGTFERYTGSFDLGGALFGGTDFAYRLTGLVRDGGTQTDYVDDNRYFFAPAVTWKPTDSTQFTVLANIQYDQSGTPVGLPAEYTVNASGKNLLSPSLFLGDPALDTSSRTLASIGYEFQHAFNDAWQIRQNARYLTLNWNYSNLYYSALSASNPVVASRGTSYNDEDQRAITIDTQLQGEFMTGALSHTLLMGFDYRHFTQNDISQFGTAPDINLLVPVYNMSIPANVWYSSVTDGTISQAGLYAQDQIRYGKWLVTLGLRHDWASTNSTDFTNFGNTVQDQTDAALTGRVGLTYLFDNGVAPYFSYSTSFEPVIGSNPTVLGGGAFQPSEGEQYEIGVKYQPVGWNGFFTASVYDLTQTNVLTTDLIDGVSYQVQTGEVNVRGIELSALTSLADGLNLILNYTYMDAEIIGGENAGNRPANVPENTANAWLDYTFKTGNLKGFGLGAGVRYVGERYALDNNDILLDANTLFDAAVHFEKGPFKAQININNIANETYVASCGFFGCYYGDGRTVVGQLTYKW